MNSARPFAALPVLVVSAVMLAAMPALADSNSFMDPQGPVALAQKNHLIRATALIMIAVIPVLVLVPLIVWRYRRRKNSSAAYRPKWEFSPLLETTMWSVPVLIVAILSVYLWKATHRLDPYAANFGSDPAVEVQVVGLDWKWLFIYPELGIATVGEMGMPVDRQIAMELTTDTVMQSFLISALGGQIYAMPGMTTQLHLAASEPGRMQGENTQYNGRGFTGQKFDAVVMEADDFEAWVDTVRSKGRALDDDTYRILAQRSDRTEVQQALATPDMPETALYFTLPDAGLFDKIVHRYHNGTALPDADQPGTTSYGQEATQ
ncbi:cytochrome ubiquinol oxidase subunit II [Ruegeria sp. 2205SS24-7]|uniref:cytochrome ubiquinol oxidase subunit II n=1 Tax=Ruegeria discodermiae TaxID=3064389 RepID=UPI0027423D32|nr:cytochrome ubiquinol oxidase subunit II [Ruegeria sp. 2205SS24-7]MDP5218096.1 cytochrome ubiquinol oxidase subunit II [Ruegeria sp. 2205SS24-7]